jgi:uncharacterized protein
MYKLSSYNYWCQYRACYLLYNSLSERVFVFKNKEHDKLLYLFDNLSEFETHYPDIFNSFMNGGFIIDYHFDEIDFIKLCNRKKIYDNTSYHITINPTLDCNLNCWYCSVKQQKAQFKDTLMTQETLKSIMSFFRILIEEEHIKNVHVAWFGGEPTIFIKEIIFPLCEFLKKYEESVSIMHSITTNATLLNEENLQLMKSYNFKSFQIPIDGDRDRHNIIKKTRGFSSYDIVMHNISLISHILPEANIIIRVNYDRRTLDNIDAVIKDLPKGNGNIVVDFQRVWQVPMRDVENLRLKEVKSTFNDNGYKSGYWAYIPNRYYRCYADVYNYLVINYDGNVFKCSARDYSDKHRIGTIEKDGRITKNIGVLSRMYSFSTFENEICLKCKHLPLCFGPCIQKCYEVKTNQAKFECMYDYAEIDISSYIIEKAKNLSLI